MLTRAELGLSSNDFAILSIGDLNRNKNHGVLIEAMPLLPVNVKLLIAGDGPLRDELMRKAAELGVADRVQLLGFRRDVPALLNACDLFCMPSLREGLPVSLVEAMATGTPCLASSARGCGDVLGELETECVVEGGSPGQWSKAIGGMFDYAPACCIGAALRKQSRAFAQNEAVCAASAAYELLLER